MESKPTSRLAASFRRVTSSNRFIPEIDGLRFIAIFSVVLIHLSSFFSKKDLYPYNAVSLKDQIEPFFTRFSFGVELFFIISGFILSLPFINHFEGRSEKPDLKQYYLRRVTRLEPPYIASLTLFLVGAILIHKAEVLALLKSYFASLFYLHGVIYPGEASLINCVIWSLEIEIQFYLLAPLLAQVFRIRRSVRRPLILVGILTSILLQQYFRAPTRCLYDYLQYFLAGFLLSDFYLTKPKDPFGKNPALALLFGAIAFVGIWGSFSVHYRLAFAFAFYFLVLFNSLWRRMFSNAVLTTIGGMCYSIYLLHYPIISFFGNPVLRLPRPTDLYFVNWILYGALLFLGILFISGLFFKWIEQPCMRKDWYKGVLRRIGFAAD
jgi:peptidoglycan/LPS O-acetylase OafA/YrhL